MRFSTTDGGDYTEFSHAGSSPFQKKKRRAPKLVNYVCIEKLSLSCRVEILWQNNSGIDAVCLVIGRRALVSRSVSFALGSKELSFHQMVGVQQMVRSNVLGSGLSSRYQVA